MRFLYVAFVLSLSAPVFIHAADVVLMEEIVAKVNGDIITSTELRDDRKAVEEELTKQGITGAQYEQALTQQVADLLRNRIDEILLRQKGKDLSLKVEADVNKQIGDFQRQFKLPDPDAFQRFVAEQTGSSYEDFKSKLTDTALVQGVIREEVMRKIQVPAEEVRAYFDEHKGEFQRQERVFLRELLIASDGKKTPEELTALEAKAKALGVRAKNGEAFTSMVTNNSDNEMTKERGGMLDPFTRGQLNPVIENEVWDKQPGYVTSPIKFDNGWELFKVEDHQREGLAGYEEVEGEIQNMLYGQRQGPATRAYLTKLRNEAFLQIKDGYVDSGIAPGKDTRWGDVATLKPETITREEVIANPSMKRLLGMFPVPGTKKTGASSSR
ncbi:MAG: peptidylprolyl isomerase [Bryobacteraceae bacterium]